MFADMSRLRVGTEIDEPYVASLKLNRKAIVVGRGIGDKKIDGTVVLIKGLIRLKTVFFRDASERKDVDIVQSLLAWCSGGGHPNPIPRRFLVGEWAFAFDCASRQSGRAP